MIAFPEETAVRIDCLDAGIPVVRHQQFTRCVEAQSHGAIEAPVDVSLLTENPAERTVEVEDLDPMVVGVRDVDFSLRRNSHALGFVEIRAERTDEGAIALEDGYPVVVAFHGVDST